MIQLKNNIRAYMIMIWLIGLAAKLVFFRIQVLEDLSLLGLLSDIATTGFLMFLPAMIGSDKWRKALQTLMAFIVSSIWFAVAIYYSYYGNVPTFYTLGNLNQVGQIRQSIFASIEPSMLLYFIDFIVAALLLLILPRVPQTRSIRWSDQRKAARPRINALMGVVICVLIMAGCLAGSWSIENGHALAKRLGVLNYQLAVALHPNQGDTVSKAELTEQERNELQEEIKQQLQAYQQPGDGMYHGVAEGKNLIVLQVEAMQNFVINLEVNGQIITPNLNKLAAQHFYFPSVYQQIAEGNTSDAEYMMNTGAYPSAVQASSKQLTGKMAYSLPRLLDEYGYQSLTFHVNDVSFWNRNEMYPALGFTQYYDKPSFINDEFNYYGASDEQLFNVALAEFQKLKSSQQPFYAQVVTVSSHHPFKIPQQYQVLELPVELEDTQLGHYLQAMHYVDEQIGVFLAQLQELELLEQSVIAIYGDHFGLQQKDNDADWVSKQLDIPYDDNISRMNIPFIVAVPGVEGEVVERVGGQVDMLPTLMNLLGIEADAAKLLLFGEDLLNTDTNIVGVRYYLPTGSFYNDEVLFIPGEGFHDGKAISLDNYEQVTLTPELEEDYKYILDLLKLSDLYTNNYPSR